MDQELTADPARKKSSPSRPPPSPAISSPLPLRSSASITDKVPSTPPAGKGKRKAEEVEGNTPPDVRKHRATFAADPRPHRASERSGTSSSSHAPSSYTRKRAKLSAAAITSTSPMDAVGETEATGSRPPSRSESQRNQNAATTGTWNSTRSRNSGFPVRPQSRTSHRSQARHNAPSIHAPSRRGSISQASIPISALISPHAPSISHHHAPTFHMRDPRKPTIQPTNWKLAFPQAGYGETGYLTSRITALLGSKRGRNENVEEQKEENLTPLGWYEGGGSPLHAWLFFIGFIVFPLWWIASVTKIPRTRRIEGGHDGQKSVVLDDPQVEHDAKSWRFRCRIMSVVSLFTYIPFIILIAIFVPRR